MISHEIFFIIYVLGAYFVGSIPFGLVFSKLLSKDDLRRYGSCNIGATNAFRTGGKTLGILTFLADFLKGSAVVYFCLPHVTLEKLFIISIVCVIGHIFSIWLILFSNLPVKGGKGVATALGTILILCPPLFCCMIAIWGLVFFTFKISALSALISFFVAPFIGGFLLNLNTSFMIYLILLSILVCMTHRQNIKKMMRIEKK